MSTTPNSGSSRSRSASFPSTHWSLVSQLGKEDSVEAREAFTTLYTTYWYPLFVYFRRQTGSHDAAEDLTQEFLARLMEPDWFKGLDRTKGKFRSYLLACCRHFLANERDRQRAQKRGGGCRTLSLDFASAGERYLLEPADHLTAEKLFERRWALTLLEQTLEQLKREFAQGDKGALFDRLKDVLLQTEGAASYAEIGRALGMSEAAIKKAAQRLRQRYRAVLREQVAATVATPEQVDDEIRALFAALQD
jgi:RNA polymerase sigma-70 factor (ECF subfamily)